MLFTSTAYAMAGAPAGGEGAGGMAMLIPWILMFAVFYFLLIRPQQKRAKEHKAMISSLKRGDEIVTSSGFYGRVLEVAEDYLVVDLGDTKVKMSRAAVSGLVSQFKEMKQQAEKKAGKKKDLSVKAEEPDSEKK